MTRKRSILAPPDVLPEHAPILMNRNSTMMASGPPLLKPGVLMPVVDITDTH